MNLKYNPWKIKFSSSSSSSLSLVYCLSYLNINRVRENDLFFPPPLMT